MGQLRLGQPVIEGRRKAMVAWSSESASDFSFRLAAALTQVVPSRLQYWLGLRPQLRRDFLGEYLPPARPGHGVSHHFHQPGQVFRIDLGRKLDRGVAGCHRADHPAASHSKIVNAIRGRVTGGLLFALRHLLPSFPQRGQRVIAERQVWDGASFRSGPSGFIACFLSRHEGDNEAAIAFPQ
jgi:hypothetical protein